MIIAPNRYNYIFRNKQKLNIALMCMDNKNVVLE